MNANERWMQVSLVEISCGRSSVAPGGSLRLGAEGRYAYQSRQFPLEKQIRLQMRSAGLALPVNMQLPHLVQVRERRREMVLVLRVQDAKTSRQLIVWRRVPKWFGRKMMGMFVGPKQTYHQRQERSRARLGQTMEDLSRQLSGETRIVRRRR
jgi:hypothetical protein